jgi:hypothetical protein
MVHGRFSVRMKDGEPVFARADGTALDHAAGASSPALVVEQGPT